MKTILIAISIIVISVTFSGCAERYVPVAQSECEAPAVPYSLEEIEKNYRCSHRG